MFVAYDELQFMFCIKSPPVCIKFQKIILTQLKSIIYVLVFVLFASSCSYFVNENS